METGVKPRCAICKRSVDEVRLVITLAKCGKSGWVEEPVCIKCLRSLMNSER